METSFRRLDANEMGLLEKLLDDDFQGRDALRLQLSCVTGRQTDESGSLALRTDENIEADIEIGSPTWASKLDFRIFVGDRTCHPKAAPTAKPVRQTRSTRMSHGYGIRPTTAHVKTSTVG